MILEETMVVELGEPVGDRELVQNLVRLLQAMVAVLQVLVGLLDLLALLALLLKHVVERAREQTDLVARRRFRDLEVGLAEHHAPHGLGQVPDRTHGIRRDAVGEEAERKDDTEVDDEHPRHHGEHRCIGDLERRDDRDAPVEQCHRLRRGNHVLPRELGLARRPARIERLRLEVLERCATGQRARARQDAALSVDDGEHRVRVRQLHLEQRYESRERDDPDELDTAGIHRGRDREGPAPIGEADRHHAILRAQCGARHLRGDAPRILSGAVAVIGHDPIEPRAVSRTRGHGRLEHTPVCGVLELQADRSHPRLDPPCRVVERKRIEPVDHLAQRSARGLDRDPADQRRGDERRREHEQDQLRGQAAPRRAVSERSEMRRLARGCRGGCVLGHTDVHTPHALSTPYRPRSREGLRNES